MVELPLELELEIFEWSAWSGSKQHQLSLLLVSSTLYTCVTPILYHTIIIVQTPHKKESFPKLVETMHAKGPDFFRPKVKGIYLEGLDRSCPCFSKFLRMMLTHFGDITSFHLGSSNKKLTTDMKPFPVLRRFQSLQSLEVHENNLNILLAQESSIRDFANITHVTVFLSAFLPHLAVVVRMILQFPVIQKICVVLFNLHGDIHEIRDQIQFTMSQDGLRWSPQLKLLLFMTGDGQAFSLVQNAWDSERVQENDHFEKVVVQKHDIMTSSRGVAEFRSIVDGVGENRWTRGVNAQRKRIL